MRFANRIDGDKITVEKMIILYCGKLHDGIHHLFNVVTAGEGVPHAVLVRAGEPYAGEETISARRNMDLGDRRLSAALAQERYVESPDSVARREAAAAQRKREWEARADRQRRPDKRQRRQIRRFTGKT